MFEGTSAKTERMSRPTSAAYRERVTMRGAVRAQRTVQPTVLLYPIGRPLAEPNAAQQPKTPSNDNSPAHLPAGVLVHALDM